MIHRFFTTLLGHWQIVLAVAALLAGSHMLAYCTGYDEGRDAEKAKQLEAESKARDLTEESAGVAAGEREADDTSIDQAQEERNHAIQSAPGGDDRPSAVSNAANCERLRRAGRDLSQFPACRGREGGGQTAPDP